MSSCKDIESRLKKAGLRVYGDYRDNYSPGWKFNHWEMKGEHISANEYRRLNACSLLGVPIRVELGPNDRSQSQLTVVLRHTGAKSTIPVADCETKLRQLLEQMHSDLYTK